MRRAEPMAAELSKVLHGKTVLGLVAQVWGASVAA